MRFSTIAAFVTSLAVVSAQTPDLSSVPDCAVACLVAAIPSSGCGVTDVTCQCTTGQQAITSSLESCIPTRCSADDVAKVAPALASVCSAAGFSVAVPSSLAATSTAASAASSAASVVSSAAGSVTGAASSVAASASSRAASAASSAPAQSTGGAAANVAGLGAVALGMFAAIL
ncbi:hypothetical protein BU25DRAFT_486637 [Macroventuria anomochaeta]|uniref:Uncharacterized protein n=1 Tax=Macroventuria anomochaeta TaxID=301207 RepID=A0ACB6SH21_9PLEO|nr:uncharacterized protein BU25DRAFT_486637 [Macroventuria anomochaeta]KAF2633575.1 hypothetical protein BU25DRAFT_486637 [Macroventuria anomochaeta]